MKHTDPAGLRTRAARGDERATASLAVGLTPAGKTAEGAFALASAPDGDPLLQVALEGDEREQGEPGADRSKD